MQTNFNSANVDVDCCNDPDDPCGDCKACKEYEEWLAIPEPPAPKLQRPVFEDGIGWR